MLGIFEDMCEQVKVDKVTVSHACENIDLPALSRNWIWCPGLRGKY